MVQQGDGQAGSTGVYLGMHAERRDAVKAACAPLFAAFDVAGDVALCQALLERGQPDLLVIDVEGIESGPEGDALARVLTRRGREGGGVLPTLLLCPPAGAGRLGELMTQGATAYAIMPLDAAGLRACVERSLAGDRADADGARQEGTRQLERRLLEVRLRAQAALMGASDARVFAQRLCATLCDPREGWPGLLHAAVFHLAPGADLRLEAQAGQPDLMLDRLLGGVSQLLAAPLRHIFPGLQAAGSGQAVLVEAPEQTGEPGLARVLRTHGVAMAAGWPIPSEGPGPARSALSLLFGDARPLTRGELATLDEIALLAAFGMRVLDTAAENEALLARLAHATTIDALTNVANRRHGEDLLEKEIRRTRRYVLPLALLAIDIDRFKAINDTYGYRVGDVALRTVADTVRAMLRGSDVLVRSGGEEFQVIATHTSATDGLRMAEKIRLAIEQTTFPGCDRLTVSVGVAQLGEQENADSLTQRAGAALARAKRAGRNCVELAMK
jgi:diguanylate cyclase (GGDEF)-like protein